MSHIPGGRMELIFLGTGTSTGVPQIGCRCRTCVSTDPKDKRMRTSALVSTSDGDRILIDCGPDFYHQMIREHSPMLSALVVTHIHYDHIGGLDDMRPYSSVAPFDVYCQKDVIDDLKSRIPYCFAENPYPGVASFFLHEIKPLEPFKIGKTEIIPFPVMHFRLPILGFKIGNLVYITDCKTLPECSLNILKGIDTLVVNALRHDEHLSHLNLSQALELIDRIKPRMAYLTHLSHQMGRHTEVEKTLPENVKIAYDGLKINIPPTI